MSYRIGQKLLCIDDRFDHRPTHAVKAGEVYTLTGFYYCPACQSPQFTLSEFPFTTRMRCGCGHTRERRQTFYAWRFVPLEEQENVAEVPEEELIAS